MTNRLTGLTSKLMELTSRLTGSKSSNYYPISCSTVSLLVPWAFQLVFPTTSLLKYLSGICGSGSIGNSAQASGNKKRAWLLARVDIFEHGP